MSGAGYMLFLHLVFN